MGSSRSTVVKHLPVQRHWSVKPGGQGSNPGVSVRISDEICKFLPDFSLYLMLIVRVFVVSVCIN